MKARRNLTRTPTGRSFVIRTVSDFAALPEECIDACLSEFGTALKMQPDLHTLLTPPEHPGCVKPYHEFTWTDDGKREYAFRMEILPPSQRGAPPR